MELDLGEMTAGLSQMTFELDDVKDTSGLSYFGQLTAPGAWETGYHVRIEPGSAPLQQVDADATSIPIKGNVAGFPSSGTAYIGSVPFTFTDKNDGACRCHPGGARHLV